MTRRPPFSLAPSDFWQGFILGLFVGFIVVLLTGLGIALALAP